VSMPNTLRNGPTKGIWIWRSGAVADDTGAAAGDLHGRSSTVAIPSVSHAGRVVCVLSLMPTPAPAAATDGTAGGYWTNNRAVHRQAGHTRWPRRWGRELPVTRPHVDRSMSAQPSAHNSFLQARNCGDG
jgi:hypothetical protein